MCGEGDEGDGGGGVGEAPPDLLLLLSSSEVSTVLLRGAVGDDSVDSDEELDDEESLMLGRVLCVLRVWMGMKVLGWLRSRFESNHSRATLQPVLLRVTRGAETLSLLLQVVIKL